MTACPWCRNPRAVAAPRQEQAKGPAAWHVGKIVAVPNWSECNQPRTKVGGSAASGCGNTILRRRLVIAACGWLATARRMHIPRRRAARVQTPRAVLDAETSWDEVLLRLAAARGGLLGWNRETHAKLAGLRTNILVAMGAALFAMIGIELSSEVRAAGGQSDPVRVLDGIASGIGFLGAATVLRSRRGVEGITTAAAIWLVAAIGAACGIGAYQTAGIATAIAWFTLTVLGAVIGHFTGVGGIPEGRRPISED